MRDELEAAIIASPDDPAPRAVYADWLMAQPATDDRALGEWMALATRDDAERTAHRRTRAVAVGAARLEAASRTALFGAAGTALVRSGHAGFHGGLVDELRLHGPHADAAAVLADLLARPAVRLVRRIAIGRGFGDPDAVIAAIAHARLPLLAELVAIDATDVDDPPTCDIAPIVAAHPNLAVLALRGARCAAPPPTTTRVLVVSRAAPDGWAWLAAGAPLPALEELWLEGPLPVAVAELADQLARLPRLVELRAFEVGAEAARTLANALDARGVATRYRVISPIAALARLGNDDLAGLVHPSADRPPDDELARHIAASDRLRRIPALGRALRPRTALGDEPQTYVAREALANDLVAHSAHDDDARAVYRAYADRGRWLDAEILLARDGERMRATDRLRATIEIARATDRLRDAEAALATVADAELAADPELTAACAVVDLRAGRHEAAIARVDRYDAALRGREARAILAHGYLARGESARAAAMLGSHPQLARSPLELHARAALELADGADDTARATLADLRARYPHALDRGWLAVDPKLEALR